MMSMMNLFEFLESWEQNTVINVKTEEKEIFYGKIVDLSEEDASRYWVTEGGVLLENEVTILVEHEDEVNRKLEEQNEISFRKIFEYMREDITLSLELKHQYDLVIKSANQYNFYRNMILGEENMEAINKKRKFYQDIFIDMLDQYADRIEEETAHKVAWRVALGSDKQKLGEFAEYISHVIESVMVRKTILEAIKWAQEHHNIVGGIIAGAADSMNARQQLMNHFGLWVKIRQNLSKKFYNPDIQTVIKIQKRSIMKMTGTWIGISSQRYTAICPKMRKRTDGYGFKVNNHLKR